MKNRPVLDLPKTATERWLDIVSWICVALAFAFALGNYSSLPDTIPTHFNIAGEADDHGSKNLIFALPVLSFLLAAGMIFLSKFPHKFNYMTRITPENAAFQYRRARMLLRIINALSTLMLALLTWTVISAAQGQTATLGLWFWTLIALIVAMPWIIMFVWKNKASRRNS